MFNLTAQQKQTALWLGVAAALCALLYLLGPVLVPFALAAVLAYMLEPGVAWLVRKRLPRPAAVLLMIVLLGLVLLLLALILVPVLHKEAVALQQKFPAIVERLNTSVAPWLADKFDVHLRFDAETIRGLLTDHLSSGSTGAASLWSSIRVGTSAVLGIAALLFLVPMVLFYLLLDWPRLLERLRAVLPRRWEHQVVGMVKEVDTVLAQFLRGQIAVMLALAVYYSVALALAGFDVALPVGILTGLLVFIPYVGYGLGLILALVYGLGQVLEGFFLTPRLVGERIGLHPLAVIFALMAFGQLFGFVGVLIALPASAAILVGLKHVRNRYVASSFYRE
jgi:predicted PurR-regulated permease PerM